MLRDSATAAKTGPHGRNAAGGPKLCDSASGPEHGLPGRISAGLWSGILRRPRLESGRNLVRKPDFRPGNNIA